MSKWNNNADELNALLKLICITDKEGAEIHPDRSFAVWQEKTLMVHHQRRTVYLIGNGASASMASHVSADLAKNAFVHTEVFSDLSLITAIANDLSYEEVFAEPIRRRMIGGDMLVAISSSGRSPNILRAAKEAEYRGGTVITLTAMNEDNELRKMGNLNIYLPAQTYGAAETCHAAILHYWIDLVASSKPIKIAKDIWAQNLETVTN